MAYFVRRSVRSLLVGSTPQMWRSELAPSLKRSSGMAVRLERVVFAKQSLFAGDLLSKKTSKASAGTHNSQPKPEALERDQVTNPKTY